jgi:bacillithiol biosynthesis deacetylase BshB1
VAADQKVDLIFFSPHPDDVELACGGTVARLGDLGHKTAIIDLTMGELGSSGTPETRIEESRKAAEYLGVQLRGNLRLPDGHLSFHDNSHIMAVVESIRTHRPDLIVAPYWDSRHPDHGEASRLIEKAFFFSGLSKISTEQAAYRPTAVFFYMQRFEFQPSFIVDVTDTFERKLRSIWAYESQFSREAPDSVPTPINDPGFLERIKLRARYYGSQIGVEHGEPFLSRYPIGIDDPFNLKYRKEQRI